MSGLVRSALVVGVSLMATACGKKGALIYPDMLAPAAPATVSALQSGTVVKLQFALPDKDRGGRAVQGLSGVKISRRVAETSQKDVCRSCMSDYALFRTLYLDHLPADTQRFGSRLVLLDSDVREGNSYSYSVVTFTSDGVDGASSSIADVHVGPTFSPPGLTIESFPTEVKLHFTSEPLKSGRLLGYNLYRSTVVATRSYLPLNKDPLKGNEYVDTALERGVKYRYSARTVVMQAAGDVVESAESENVEGILKDDEE